MPMRDEESEMKIHRNDTDSSGPKISVLVVLLMVAFAAGYFLREILT